mgnify:CR=1 FL=1
MSPFLFTQEYFFVSSFSEREGEGYKKITRRAKQGRGKKLETKKEIIAEGCDLTDLGEKSKKCLPSKSK